MYRSQEKSTHSHKIYILVITAKSRYTYWKHCITLDIIIIAEILLDILLKFSL